MNSQCEATTADLDCDRPSPRSGPIQSDRVTAPGAHGSDLHSTSYSRLGAGIVFAASLLSLGAVAGMALLFHQRIATEDWLTGFTTACIVASFLTCAGRRVFQQIERGRWDLIASEERIRQLAHYDAVTGLPNRILLKDRLRKDLASAARTRTPMALLFLDLDRFKSVNDSLGHQAGDELLRIVGKRLENALRDVDTVARFGGDEFVVMLPRTDAQGAAEVAEKLRGAVAEGYTISGEEVKVTPSIGISLYPDDGLDMDTLMRHADTAMYRAKGDGSNTCRFFRIPSLPSGRRQTAEERDLLRASRRREFTVLYQPQIDTRSGDIVVVSALLGWNHPEKGLIAAGEFLPTAEACGLLEALAESYLQEACRQTAAWNTSGLLKSPLAIHLSRQQVKQSTLIGQIRRALLLSGLDPSLLELELSEGGVNDIPEGLLRRLLRFRDYGVRFALNEFGTGQGSLAFLTDLPVDKLKIESSFIRGLPGNTYDGIVVASMIDLARKLDMKVAADGVDSLAQLHYLRRQGCDIVQGPYHGAPVTAQCFATALRRPYGLHTPKPRAVA